MHCTGRRCGAAVTYPGASRPCTGCRRQRGSASTARSSLRPPLLASCSGGSTGCQMPGQVPAAEPAAPSAQTQRGRGAASGPAEPLLEGASQLGRAQADGTSSWSWQLWEGLGLLYYGCSHLAGLALPSKSSFAVHAHTAADRDCD